MVFGGMIIILVCGQALRLFIFAKEADRKAADNFAHVGTRLNIFTLCSEDEGESETNSVTEAAADENEVDQNRQSIIAIGSGGI